MPKNNTSYTRRQQSKKGKAKNRKQIILFLKVFLMIFLLAGIAGAGILGGILYGYIDTASDLNLENLKLDFTSFVYYIDPETNEPIELETLYEGENRIWVDMDQIPKDMQNAFVAIEDERFYKHFGVDIKRTLKATFNYVFRKNASEGGSTITQQLVKNLTGEKDISPKRKIQEMWAAMTLERKLSKEQILELYLNTIYLAQGCNGVQSAANTYFGKDVSELTLAESASIAGITQFPTRYDPFINPENNKNKQEIVLKKMLELGYINEEEYHNAVHEELKFIKSSKEKQTSKQSYFVDQVINDVLHDLKEEKGYSEVIASKMLYNGGLKIYATIDPKVQNAMDKVFTNNKNFPPLNEKVQPEAAMLVMDPYTGEVKGIVGGRGEKTANRTLNRAVQTVRQPGSSIKPIAVYAPAMEYGIITPATVYDDAPFSVGNWSPTNWYSGYRGLATVRKAIEDSMNIIAVKVLDDLGIDNSFKFLKNNLKISTLVDRETRSDGKIYTDKQLNSLALGGFTDGMSVMELTAAYVPFVNRGIYIKPYTYTKVIDHEGNVLLDKKKEVHVAMSEQTAFLMSQMLQSVVKNGTGTPARLSSGMPGAGKTGTTDDAKDRWYVGYTPYYVAATWFGFDEPKPMNYFLRGRTNPAIVLWRAVMEEIHKGLKVKQFNQAPPGIVQAQVCIDSGLKPTELCGQDPRGSRIRTEYFRRGTQPSKSCNVHVLGDVDTSTNLLANEHCPTEFVERKVFIKKSSSNASTSTADAKYDISMQKICDQHGTGNFNETELETELEKSAEKTDESEGDKININDKNKDKNSRDDKETEKNKETVENLLLPQDSKTKTPIKQEN